MKKLAVIIPNYNKALYLKQSLCSIFDQTYTNIEVFFRDDGSTDDSLDIMRYCPLPVTLSAGAVNKGVCHALNYMVDYVKGEGYDYFYIMASDDIVEPTILEKLVAMIDSEHDFYTCHAKMFGLEDKVFRSEPNLTLESFRKGSPLLTTGIYSVKMWKELGGRREDWRVTHDYEMFLRMFLRGYKHKVLDEVLYNWRNYEGQLSREYGNDIELRKKAFEINGVVW